MTPVREDIMGHFFLLLFPETLIYRICLTNLKNMSKPKLENPIWGNKDLRRGFIRVKVNGKIVEHKLEFGFNVVLHRSRMPEYEERIKEELQKNIKGEILYVKIY